MTNNLPQRIAEHYFDRITRQTFAGKYHAFFLLYFEDSEYILNIIAREKEIKGWSRKKKLELIKTYNPTFRFLNEEVFGEWPPNEVRHRGHDESSF
jgi:putative endonuclease